jgi:single-strand DNA-binding protein
MADFNKFIGMGRITRQPETRQLPNGSAVTDFGMAINRKYKSKDGQEGEEVCFVDISAWGRQGEVVAQYVNKGAPLFVEGRLKFDQWESDGQKRSKLTVVAERVQLMGAPKRDDQSPDAQQAPATAPQSAGDAVGGDDQDNLPF